MNLKIKGVKCIQEYEGKGVRPAGQSHPARRLHEQVQEIEADTLVLSYWRKANDALYEDLKGKVKEIFRVGDALSPRRLFNAIYDGYQVAMDL